MYLSIYKLGNNKISRGIKLSDVKGESMRDVQGKELSLGDKVLVCKLGEIGALDIDRVVGFEDGGVLLGSGRLVVPRNTCLLEKFNPIMREDTQMQQGV